MIVGLGIDVVELDRIERIWNRFGMRFARRILTIREQERLPRNAVAYLASRFAAKEAAVKALGTGFSQGIGFHCLEIGSQSSGKPTLSFFRAAESQALGMSVNRVHLSITHDRSVSAAVVILESSRSSG